MFWSFSHRACGILAPVPEIRSTPPALEGEVPTTWMAGEVPPPSGIRFLLTGPLVVNSFSLEGVLENQASLLERLASWNFLFVKD